MEKYLSFYDKEGVKDQTWNDAPNMALQAYIIEWESQGTPAVTSVLPKTGNRGNLVPLYIVGKNFGSNAIVKLTKSGSQSLIGTNICILSTTQIYCLMNIGSSTKTEHGRLSFSRALQPARIGYPSGLPDSYIPFLKMLSGL